MKAFLKFLFYSALINLIIPQVAATDGVRKRKGLLSTIKEQIESNSETSESSSFCPSIRYKPWFQHDPGHREFISKLGYNYYTWNFDPDQESWNPIEELSWESKDVSKVHSRLERLGYEEDSWDCCINHYYDYDWADFESWGYTEQILALEHLGWTQETYDASDPDDLPDTEFLQWKELTESQRELAASKLCYTEETWDELLSLDEWPDGFKIPDTW